MNRTCAIHQPNFFPWLGYFDKIRRADIFVFLDDVPYPRSGSNGMGSWTNRVKINVQGKPQWMGCPVERFSGRKAIKDVNISSQVDWRQRALRTLQMNYAKAPAYDRAMAVLRPLLLHSEIRLADFNIHAIKALCSALGVSAQFRRQSETSATGTATSLLIDITRAVGATAYICGGGAAGYQDDESFLREGIGLIYQDFKPFPYGLPSAYIPGLSIIDFLMWSDDWRVPE